MKKLGLIVAVFAMFVMADVAQAQSQFGVFNRRNGGNGGGVQVGLINLSNNNGGNAQNARGNRANVVVKREVILVDNNRNRNFGHGHSGQLQIRSFNTGYYAPPPAPLVIFADPHAGCSNAQGVAGYSGGCSGSAGIQFARPPCR